MSDPVDSLVMDLLDWIGKEARPYAEVMEAWRGEHPVPSCRFGRRPTDAGS
jgi:hypothetical protein